jgi:CRP-like cAMP-binding protein
MGRGNNDLGILSDVGWLARQPADFREECFSHGRMVAARRGEAIYREGDAGFSIYGLASGAIAVLLGPPRLAPRIANIMVPGTWFGAGSVLTGNPRSLEFRALSECRLLMVPGPAVEHLSKTRPEYARAIGALAIIGHNVASRVAGELLIPSSSRRIAAIVLRIASPDTAEARVGSDGIVVTQWQVAEMANVSRNVANGVLCRLRHDGWIETRYGRVTVRDHAALAAYAYGED